MNAKVDKKMDKKVDKKIDVKKAIQSKYKGYLPNFIYKGIERLVHEDELNAMMELQQEVDGVSMGFKVMDYLGVTCEIVGAQRLPALHDRSLFVSNHPLGGVDGIIYTALLGEYYQKQFNIMVNDVLMNVYQFGDIFLPINKYGAQARHSFRLINEALESDRQVMTFPAGLCSRKDSSGEIRDLKWNTSFIRMASRSKRNVVPLFFEGVNSPRFYNWTKRRERIGWKFNAELILLPSEMIRAKGKHFRIIVGDAIPYTDLPGPKEEQAFATRLRDSLYTFPRRYGQQSDNI
ncbi:MAG: 1-acyl-sn-glycerol-3-phosphate acyltransferase [Porphyromonas sp.]|nr:1-acyl-sn-glycerol-3-phosphate acyltransferase [Porphyromonas sp.]